MANKRKDRDSGDGAFYATVSAPFIFIAVFSAAFLLDGFFENKKNPPYEEVQVTCPYENNTTLTQHFNHVKVISDSNNRNIILSYQGRDKPYARHQVASSCDIKKLRPIKYPNRGWNLRQSMRSPIE